MDVQKIISTQDYSSGKNRTGLQARTCMKERHRAAGLDAHATENGDMPLRKRQSLADVTGGAR